MTIPLVIDADIGTYLDDYLAIALAMASPEIDLLAVTTNDGDTLTRARIARRLLDLGGRHDVAVAAGAGEPLLRRHPGGWAGHEGAGILDGLDPATLEVDPRHGAAVLVEEVLRRPGEVAVLAIGSLTNVALALALTPDFVHAVRRVVVMGGSLRTGPNWREVPPVEWNFAADIDAADVVLRNGMPLTVVPFDTGERARLRRGDIERLRAAGSPVQLALADQAERALVRWNSEETWPFDPLALACLIDPTLVTIEPLHVEMVRGGRFDGMVVAEPPTDDLPANADVAIDVDAPRFEAFHHGPAECPASVICEDFTCEPRRR